MGISQTLVPSLATCIYTAAQAYSQRNVLIDEERHAVLSDFGLTVLGHTTQGRIVTSFHVNGTAGWMSPERVQLWVEETNTERRIKPSADVYAFGCLCYAVR
jgi:serine/threonine protein kinase